jgi:hypothetical protein
MNMKDKTNRITLRLNDAQFRFVKATSDVLDVSPSEFLRMVVNAAMVNAKYDDKFKGVFGRANDETDIDN